MKGFKQFLKETTDDKAKKGDDAAYEAFFKKALKKFDIKADEIDELPKDKKKEFFDYVDKNWKADNEED
ncbi:MAG: hypothetical protein R3230_00010 [Nitrosopumilaceae archaeon]|nr:hypothetical protein [Nitrosopumilaceae archaeon]